ncbi:hypothetical protein D3C72_924080 [compost metagenome]
MAGKAEQLLGQFGAPLPGIQNVLEHALGACRVLCGQRQARRADDDGQHVVEVMRQATGQLAEGLQLLCLEQLGAHRVQLQRRLATVGDVPGHLGQADDLALVIANHIQRGQRPELRAILAYAPAFILRHALLQRLAQQALRAAFGAILRGEEQREMLADHFIGTVPLDALRACVPRHHMAGRVEHVDGVIHHRLNQLFIAVGRHDRVVEAVS